MSLWTAHELATATLGRFLGPQDIAVSGLSTDTRTLQPGEAYLALKGPRFDGHEFIDQALEKGAAVVISERSEQSNRNVIIVDDTFKALQDLGRAARIRSKALVFAVTGSVGKTSAKAMLAQGLTPFGSVHAAEASLNNHWGVPLSLARMPSDTNYAVFEIGMNHAGEITPLSGLVRPDISLITTVEAVHIEHLGSIENIARAKAEIFEGMTETGVVVLPRDNAQYGLLVTEAQARNIGNIRAFSKETSQANGFLKTCDATAEGSNITAIVGGKEIQFHLAIPGVHQALNAVAVLTMIEAAGLDVTKAATALEGLPPVSGRGNRLSVILNNHPSPVTIIDETHNASPVAVEAALKVLSAYPGTGRRVVILGDMLELGTNGPDFHAGLANGVRKSGAGLVLLCGPLMANLARELSDLPTHHFDNSEVLVQSLSGFIQPGDVVMIKGSRVSKMKLVVDALVQLGQVEGSSVLSSPQSRSA